MNTIKEHIVIQKTMSFDKSDFLDYIQEKHKNKNLTEEQIHTIWENLKKSCDCKRNTLDRLIEYIIDISDTLQGDDEFREGFEEQVDMEVMDIKCEDKCIYCGFTFGFKWDEDNEICVRWKGNLCEECGLNFEENPDLSEETKTIGGIENCRRSKDGDWWYHYVEKYKIWEVIRVEDFESEDESETIQLKIESDRPFEDPKDMKEFVRYKLKEGKTRSEGCKWIQENYIGYGFRMSGNIFDVFVGKE